MSNANQTNQTTPALSDTLFTILETLPGAFFVLDEAEAIMYANASAQAMLGTSPRACNGKTTSGAALPTW